jgi:phosphohistidine phosphatase SixA
MKLLLVRHCQSTGGEPEAALTARGQEAAAHLADQLMSFGPDAIYSSPYARAVSTVSPLAARLQLEIQIDDRLRERVRSSEKIEDCGTQVWQRLLISAWRIIMRRRSEPQYTDFVGSALDQSQLRVG